MSTDKYSLTDEQKQQIALDQVEQFKRERYAHELNILRAEAIEDVEQKQEVITQSEKAIATIETAIDVTLDATATAQEK